MPAPQRTYAVFFTVEGSADDPDDTTGFEAFEESLDRLLDAGTLQDAIVEDLEDHETVELTIVCATTAQVNHG